MFDIVASVSDMVLFHNCLALPGGQCGNNIDVGELLCCGVTCSSVAEDSKQASDTVCILLHSVGVSCARDRHV